MSDKQKMNDYLKAALEKPFEVSDEFRSKVRKDLLSKLDISEWVLNQEYQYSDIVSKEELQNDYIHTLYVNHTYKGITTNEDYVINDNLISTINKPIIRWQDVKK